MLILNDKYTLKLRGRAFRFCKSRRSGKTSPSAWKSGDNLATHSSDWLKIPAVLYSIRQEVKSGPNSDALFLEDSFRATGWLTLDLGIRLTTVQAWSAKMLPIRASARPFTIPRINWVLRINTTLTTTSAHPLDDSRRTVALFAISSGLRV